MYLNLHVFSSFLCCQSWSCVKYNLHPCYKISLRCVQAVQNKVFEDQCKHFNSLNVLKCIPYLHIHKIIAELFVKPAYRFICEECDEEKLDELKSSYAVEKSKTSKLNFILKILFYADI